jgi:hypothetical protein
MANAQGPQPPSNYPWTAEGGRPSLAFLQYMLTLDATVKALAGNLLGSPVQLANAANDAANSIATAPSCKSG